MSQRSTLTPTHTVVYTTVIAVSGQMLFPGMLINDRETLRSLPYGTVIQSEVYPGEPATLLFKMEDPHPDSEQRGGAMWSAPANGWGATDEDIDLSLRFRIVSLVDSRAVLDEHVAVSA